jgi:hypothetical protein
MSCELTQEQRAAQEAIQKTAWKALAGAGLNPYDWMLMEWKRTNDSWNGDTLFHFKSIDQRLYIYIPSKWAGVAAR